MTAPIFRFDGSPVLDGYAVSGDAPDRGSDAPDAGQLWQRVGSATGPVRGTRRFAVGAVVDSFEGKRIRAIETETRDEFCISRVRRPHEIAEGVYPHAATYAVYTHPDA